MNPYRPLCCLIVFLLLFNPLLGAQRQCQTDEECSNGQGKCLKVGPSSYCSCLSGFGGDDCSLLPHPLCAFKMPSTDFKTNSSLDASKGNLTLSVVAHLEHSKVSLGNQQKKYAVPYSEELTITFGDGSFHECNYPTSNDLLWMDHPSEIGDCNDRYSLSLRFADAKSKCGFTDKKGNRVFEQTMHIKRKYHSDDPREQSMSQTQTSVKKLYLKYPESVKHTSVARSGTPSLLSAITFVDFDPSSENWTVEATTSVEAPFQLLNPVVVSATGEIATYSRFVLNSELISLVYGCENNTVDCFQKITLKFNEGNSTNACEGLTGDITIRMNLTCNEGLASAGCPLDGSETVQTVISLSTSNACPITEQVSFSTTSMDSFSNEELTHSRTSFLVNQIGYFGVTVESDDALITGRYVKNNTVCFQIGSGACNPVLYDILPTTNGMAPVFSVDFSHPNNSNVFGFLSSSGSSQVFSVHAVVGVDFSEVKATHAAPEIQETQLLLTTSVKLIPTYLEYSSATLGSPSLALLFVFISVIVLLL